jgi:acyl-CoA thioesterase-2
MRPLSIHTNFLEAGNSRFPIVYECELIRNGRNFQHWSIRARQDEISICQSIVMLHHPESGPEYAGLSRDKLDPEAFSSPSELNREGTARLIGAGFEIRRAGWSTSIEGGNTPWQDAWYRCLEEIPPGWEDAVLAWCTDLELAWTVDLPYRRSIQSRVGASLDHVIQFHRPLDVSQWWLYEREGSALSSGRGFATGQIFDINGFLVASVAQRTLLRIDLQHG